MRATGPFLARSSSATAFSLLGSVTSFGMVSNMSLPHFGPRSSFLGPGRASLRSFDHVAFCLSFGDLLFSAFERHRHGQSIQRRRMGLEACGMPWFSDRSRLLASWRIPSPASHASMDSNRVPGRAYRRRLPRPTSTGSKRNRMVGFRHRASPCSGEPCRQQSLALAQLGSHLDSETLRRPCSRRGGSHACAVPHS